MLWTKGHLAMAASKLLAVHLTECAPVAMSGLT